MQCTAFSATNIGRSRERNEDALLVDEQVKLFIVCDGMGGHAAGDIASQKTTEFFAQFLRENRSTVEEAHLAPGGYFKVVELAERATLDTCQRLHQLASAEPKYAGMGTTLTALLIVNNKGVMSHVGDSRLYLLRDEKLHLLSSDHTLANEMLQRGLLQPEDFDASPYQHVLTRSVGGAEAVEAEMLLFDVLPQDTFLLCTDGLTNYIEDAEELMEFLRREDLSSTLQELVALANLRGGKDNITAVAVRATAGQHGDAEQDTRVKAEALQSTFLCEGLSYSRLIRLVESSQLKEYQSGERILEEGLPCEGLYLIVSGQVSISCEGALLTTLRKGECFCETALVQNRKARATVNAVEPTTLLILPRVRFQRLARRFPKIGRVLQTRLLNYLGSRLDEVGRSP